jgi:hypothetical protein
MSLHVLIFFSSWTFRCPNIFFLFHTFAQPMPLKPHIRERSLYFRTWSIYLTNMFLSTPSVWEHVFVYSSVGAAYISGCTWFWSWEHDKSLNKGQQDLTKLNTKNKQHMWKAWNFQDITFDFSRNFSPIEEYVILWFYNIFYQNKFSKNYK